MDAWATGQSTSSYDSTVDYYIIRQRASLLLLTSAAITITQKTGNKMRRRRGQRADPENSRAGAICAPACPHFYSNVYTKQKAELSWCGTAREDENLSSNKPPARKASIVHQCTYTYCMLYVSQHHDSTYSHSNVLFPFTCGGELRDVDNFVWWNSWCGAICVVNGALLYAAAASAPSIGFWSSVAGTIHYSTSLLIQHVATRRITFLLPGNKCTLEISAL